MAPSKRGTKRAAQALEENPVDKKLFDFLKAQDIPRPTYKAVVDALEHPLLALPEECRKMLLTMVPTGLCMPSDQRHELQVQGVEMIGKAIQDIQAKMREVIDVEQAAVAKVESSGSELVGNLQTTMDALTEEQEKLGASNKVLEDASNSLFSAKSALAAKLVEQANFDSSCAEIKADKEEFERVIANDLKVLIEGTWEEGQAQKHFDVLATLFGKFALEESLRSVLPGSLLKKPEERGSFEVMAVTQLDQSIKGKLSELKSAVEQEAPRLKEMEAAVTSAQSISDAASEAEKDAASAVSIAQEREKTAIAAVTAAEEALAAGEAALKKASDLRDQKKSELEAFAHNIECYSQLKEKVSAAGA